MPSAISAALVGVDGVPIEVEVRVSSQLPRIDIVGLPEAAVRESAARVRSAITAAGHAFPNRRITVNLAPAALRKHGAGLDLPIAVGVLAAAGSLPVEALRGCGFIGELALDGRLRAVRGVLALATAMREAGCRQVIVPRANGAEGALAPGVDARAADDLPSVVAHLLGGKALDRCVAEPPAETTAGPCLSEVRGQRTARRALEIAAAGGHGLLLCGPPGSGKTMLASRLAPLLPPLSDGERLEVTRIHGVAGLSSPEQPVVVTRPMRSPHHSASRAGLLGGGNPPRPGEVSLAHRGVLFLDELPEFERRALEALREVLEEGAVRIARAGFACRFPARFQFVAASNPCPCGWWRSGVRDCRCDPGTIDRYHRRLSGPLLDRIDLHVFVSPVPWRELDAGVRGEASKIVAERVRRAIVRARERSQGVAATRRASNALAGLDGRNATLPDASLDRLAAATPEARALLGQAVDRLGLSARAARRTLRVARTVADLAGAKALDAKAMAEALGFRQPSSSQEAGSSSDTRWPIS